MFSRYSVPTAIGTELENQRSFAGSREVATKSARNERNNQATNERNV
jgi:hypothetical protein